jgi:hypothetical protein
MSEPRVYYYDPGTTAHGQPVRLEYVSVPFGGYHLRLLRVESPARQREPVNVLPRMPRKGLP